MNGFNFTDEMKIKFEAIISDDMAQTKTPGMSIAIVKDDQIIYNGNFGASNLEKRLETNGDTLYRIASVTKCFVSLGILILESQGKLDINDPISKYIPVTLGNKNDPITLHHLMTHTSGIPDVVYSIHEFHNYENKETEMEFPHIPMTSWEDFYRHINGASEYLQKPPGEHLHYQNDGYGMLGRIIEVVSGLSLNDFTTKYILDPLEMNRSTFLQSVFSELDNVATPYIMSNQKKRIVKSTYEQDNDIFGYAAGGLLSSVKEMANYLIFHMNHGNFKGNQILSSEKLEEMYKFHFVETPMNRLFGAGVGTFGKSGYGYGFGLYEDFYGYKLVHHSGSWIGSSAWLAFIPELKIGIISLANKHPSPRMYALAALSMMIGKDLEKDFPLLKYQAHLKKLSGHYESYKGSSSFKIFPKDGTLWIKLNQFEYEIPLMPFIDKTESPITFDYYYLSDAGGKEPLQFSIVNDEIWFDLERIKAKKVKDL
ncbi:MAG: serine hydrolase [Candidatus Heimdallarchaeota archaeon]|nr:serine hydrolase [Candidatus Heimdallarchaeota archaeon]